MIKPAALRPGDLVRLIAPSSPPVDEASLPQAIRGLESLGYRIGYSPGILRRHGFLAGRDEERARDLEEAFADPEAKAVFCLRGGYGSGRLLSPHRLGGGMFPPQSVPGLQRFNGYLLRLVGGRRMGHFLRPGGLVRSP